MKLSGLVLALVLVACGSERRTWHDDYIADNCARGNWCCTNEGNALAQADEGAVCAEENEDLRLQKKWTHKQLERWCRVQSQ